MKLLLFARARDLARADWVDLDVPAGTTVAGLRTLVANKIPALADIVQRSAFAIGDEYAGDDVPVPPGAEVALLPPVSGG